MAAPANRLTDSEWTVMDAIWDRGSATAREVLEDVQGGTGWAYTTVKTMLARLTEKGIVAERKRGNTSVYEAVLSRQNARRSALHSLLDRAFDGTIGTLMQHMVRDEKLSKKDRAELTRMLEELEGGGRS